MTYPISGKKECRSVRNWTTCMVTGGHCACAHPTGIIIMAACFQKSKQKQDDGDVFGWIFGHVSLLKLEKDVEDDNRYSMLQIDFASSRKYSHNIHPINILQGSPSCWYKRSGTPLYTVNCAWTPYILWIVREHLIYCELCVKTLPATQMTK